MDAIKKVFKKENGYVGFLTAGDGGLETSFNNMLALVEGGVNILEVGIPFSDPVADGPVIQRSSFRALKRKINLAEILKMIRKVKSITNVPIVLFSYYNPLFIKLKDGIFEQAKEAGVDACLIVDISIEESELYCSICSKVGIDPIFLISPSTTKERIKAINSLSKGMLYYVCRKGVTGVKDELPGDFIEKLNEINSIATLPVVAGFGIANRETASKVLQYADGFVVGSRFVQAVEENYSYHQLVDLVKNIDPRKRG